jgi:uncharacterized membrane protein YcaP (DUF421 family)
MVLISALGIYAALLVLTRITGLRSFAKMSSFDFAITVAFGSVLASTILAPSPDLLTGAFGLVVLYGIQYGVSASRRLTATIEALVDNEPLLIMAGEKVLSDHLDKARMTEDDLRSKLRMAGVSHPSQVLAVVFETSGDVSVVKTSDEVDPWVFASVRGAEHLPFMSGAT